LTANSSPSATRPLPSGGIFDAPTQKKKLAESEAQIASPDFWNQPEKSQKVMQARKRLEEAIANDDRIRGMTEDLDTLFELARSHAPAVLVFDEVEAFAADRNDLKRSAGRALIDQFLAELDGTAGALSIGLTIFFLYSTGHYQLVTFRGFDGTAGALVTIAIAAVFEELAFRGVILSALEPVIGNGEALLVSAMMFAILHLAIPSIPHLFIMGVALAWLKQRSGSLYPGMVLHFSHNFLVLLTEQHRSLSPW